MVAKKISPIKYFIIALAFFAALGCEYLVFFLDRIIDGRDMSNLFSWSIHWYGAISHWFITIIIWGSTSLLFYRWLKKNNILHELFRFKINKFDGIMIICVTIIVILDGVIEARADHYVFPQLLSEYYGFQNMYGSYAWLVSIFQNIYYLFETIVVLLMVICFQKAGELWFHNAYIPWASIGLVITWGAVHFISHPAGALGVLIWSIFPGIIYVISKKSIYPTFAVLFLAFLI